MNYAEESEEYDHQFVEDVKSVGRVLKLYLPLPIFWALFDQQVRPLRGRIFN